MNNSKLIGKKLANRYEIIKLIGLGGMAAVYEGRCELLKREVAIKVLKEEFRGDADVVKSFKSEAQAAAGLSDANIVSVFDVGEEDGIDYIVMELVHGKTLKQYIREKKCLPWREACDFAIQICNALSVAHAGGIIHRDIKPQNVIVTNDKVLKVTDFGIAKAATSETATINTNDAMGSVHYISPEQARGGFTDARSDIYSLGIVMYEMLTGKVPFDSMSAVAVALMHIEKEAADIKTLNNDVPAALSYIVAKTMSKEPHARYQSAEALAADIRAALEDAELPSMAEKLNAADAGGATRVIDTKTIDKLAADNRGQDKPDEPEDDFDDFFDADEEQEEPVAQKPAEPETQNEKSVVREKSGNGRRKKQKREKTADEKKADVRATVLAVMTVIVLVGSIIGGYFLIMNKSGNVRIPDVTNCTVEYAAEKINNDSIRIVTAREEYSDKYERGRIISQLPREGWTSNLSELRVVISKGPSGGGSAVPDISGMDVNDAQAAILGANMACDFIEDTASADESGKISIIGQSPLPGTLLKTVDERSDDDKEDIYTVYIVINGTQKQLVQNMAGVYDGGVSDKDSDKTEADKKENSGKAQDAGTKEISLQVPEDGDPSGIFTVTADGEIIFEEERAAGETVDVTVEGPGSVEIEAYYDDVRCFKQTIDIDG